MTTLHGRLDLKDLPEAYARWREYPLVSISDDQRAPLPDANWLATIPHGLAEGIYAFNPSPERALLSRVPRPDLAGKAPRPRDRHRQALGSALEDRRQGRRRGRGLLPRSHRAAARRPLGRVRGRDRRRREVGVPRQRQALLFPIDWPEPFGLVMIEAMACGTPVVAWRRGSVPEIVDHGETGFIVATEDEAVEALARLHLIDRRGVRDVFEQRFTATVMARNYLRLYWRLYAGITGGRRRAGSAW